MTRSADDETLRVPAGCPKHPVHRPCLRRTPGRDSTLERRRPRGEKRRRASIESCLSFTSWRALGPCLQDCDSLARPGDVREQLRCHATTHAMATRMSASKRSAIRHLAFCASEDRRFRSGWPPRVPFPISEPRATWLPRRLPFPKERRVVSDRICLLASPASTTLLHGSTLAESASPLAGTKRAR